jgi:hypothetical protein
VGDEHIRVLRYSIPVLANLHQTLACEGPVATDRVDRRSLELHAFDGDSRILKAARLCQVRPCQLRLPVEEQIVIAGDDEFMFEG